VEDIAFYCVICGQILYASLDLAGGVAECPTCLSMAPIPPDTCRRQARMRAGPKFFPGAFLSIEIVYRCEACGKPFQADARWQGHECPQCAVEAPVPKWADAPVTLSRASAPPRPMRLTPDEVEFLTGPERIENEPQEPAL
jgi:DNA-directed RNA polymerase subunit RPC12/RpoP